MNSDYQQTNQPTPSSVAAAKKPFYKQVWFIITAGIIGVLIGLWLLMLVVGLLLGGSSSSPASEKFYKMVEAASQKSKVRYGYEMRQAEGENSLPVYARSLAEYDANSKQYSLVFVAESLSPTAGRCVKGKEYRTDGMLFETLAEAEASLQKDWQENTNRIVGTCDYTKTRYQGSFTDGILPIGISEQQASNMVAALKAKSSALIFTDEGMATYSGRQGRKISFEISKEKTGQEDRANLFFFAFRDGYSNDVGANYSDIDTIRNNFETRLNVTTPVPELKGYYIIDEKTNLPIYSEIITTAGGLPNFRPVTQLSAYEFPETLTMDKTAPLKKISTPSSK